MAQPDAGVPWQGCGLRHMERLSKISSMKNAAAWSCKRWTARTCRAERERKLTPRQELINELYRTTTPLDNEDIYNSFIQVPLLDYVKDRSSAGALRGLWRNRQLGSPGPLRSGAGKRPRLRSFRATALGNDAVHAGISRPDNFHSDHRSWTRQRIGGLERTRSRSKGIRKYLDCGHGPGHTRARRTRKWQDRSRRRKLPRRWPHYWARITRKMCRPRPRLYQMCGDGDV